MKHVALFLLLYVALVVERVFGVAPLAVMGVAVVGSLGIGGTGGFVWIVVCALVVELFSTWQPGVAMSLMTAAGLLIVVTEGVSRGSWLHRATRRSL